jgi:enoyl-CoA hydratase
MSDADPVLVEIVGPVGIIELNRPEKFNCLSVGIQEGLPKALQTLEAPGSGVRVILLRARGKHFCTGADLEGVKALRAEPARFAEFVQGSGVLKALEASELPVVAAVHGLCLAGGLELMLACDVVFAASDARFGDQHAQYGLVPGWGGSQRLPRIIGLRRALDLFYSARWLDAQTALQFGLVNYVEDPQQLQQAAFEYCQTLAQRSRPGMAAMKRLGRRGLDMEWNAALRFEEEVVVDVLLGQDVTEGLTAFEERRKPVFKS